ncbi:MAG: AAA family ATPase [Candidatus Woesebacteria bacterium]|nr:AAA family ATPase [Candidatus Woesebacteria bacterium]
MIVIGITGTLGAGKGTVVDYLVNKKGFKHYSVGDYLKEKLIKKEVEPNRDNLREVANQIMEKYGPDYITRKLFLKAKKEKEGVIIESIRNPKEAEFIRTQKNGYLFAVDANQKTRYLRIQKRNSEKDNITFKKFKEQEKKESQSKDPNAQNLPKCISMADYKFDNNGTINKLYEKVEKVINKIS